MKYRHELKHEISQQDRCLLRQRCSVILQPDSNCRGGSYSIRSLYFDDDFDSALREKLDGVNVRDKFRIRFYNGDTCFIRLEKKSKVNGLCGKQSARISAEEAQMIVDGNLSWMMDSPDPLVRELYIRMKQGLKPKVIVDYTREPFVFPAGNVRVTIDSNIRTGTDCRNFLKPDCVTIPTASSPTILEVKWDEYLPDLVRDAVSLENRRAGAYSKYAACRCYK